MRKGRKPAPAVRREINERLIEEIEQMAQQLSASVPASSPQHLAALMYFSNLANRLTLEQCREILEETSSEFVICTLVQNSALIVIRKWTTLEPRIKRDHFDYFLGRALFKYGKSLKIRAEMLRSCAKLLKRSTFDGHACDFDSLASKFYVLFTDREPEIHRITYEFFVIILDEFDKCWKADNIGLPYDFQLYAKLAFEERGLLEIFSKCIRIISQHCVFVGDFNDSRSLSMIEYLLRISVFIFKRNFGIHHFSKKSGRAIRGPPKTWKPLFLWNEFLQIFFKLHKFFRNERSISLLTTNCITELASIRDVVLIDITPDSNFKLVSSSGIPFVTAYDRYISDFLANLIWIFNSEAVMPEIYNYCLIIVNVLSNHSIYSLAHAEASFPTFISFIPILMKTFAAKLLDSKQRNENEDGNETAANEAQSGTVTSQKWAYISAIQYLLKGWSIVLQNAQFVKELTGRWFEGYKMTMSIISSFMHAIFSVPFGEREEISVPLPDREIFKEILVKIGLFSSYFFGQTLPKIFTILAETVEEFLSTMETHVTVEDLNMWRENMHWILLIVGHSLVEEDDNHNCIFQNSILNYYENVVTREDNDFSTYASYIKACIDEPQDLTDPSDVDLVIKIIGTVFAWFSIEDIFLKDHGMEAISIELCGTSLWCAKRLISALGRHIQIFGGKANQLAKVSKDIIQLLIDFALQKSFRILECMPDDKKICTDAIELLSTLAYTTCRETSKSIYLYSYLTTINIEQIALRSSLLKVLIQFGSIINDEGKQQILHEMILIPIREKFMAVCEEPIATSENVKDLLEYFCAIADATQKCLADFLFEYLKPVLNFCIDLLSLYGNSISVVNAILQFFNCFTKRLSIYCDNHNNMLFIYDMLLELVQMYEVEQAERYKTFVSKEKATDLIILLEILINVLDKRNRPVNLLTGKPILTESRSQIIVMACNVLLALIRYDFFKLPMLRKNFYRFLKSSTEVASECIAKLPEENFVLLVDYLRRGLQSESEKDDLLCSVKDVFEQEVSINSANAITNLGIYFTKHIRNEAAIKNFSILIEPTFKICLNATWQEDVQSLPLSAALYSLSCCDEDECKTYIKNLLSREINYPNRTLLRSAFRRLMADTPGKRLQKSEQRNFHERLKHFLIETKGRLTIE